MKLCNQSTRYYKIPIQERNRVLNKTKFIVILLFLVPSLYLIFATSNSIRRLSLEGTEYYDVVLVPNLERVSYIDYHLTSPTEGRIYWSDPSHNSIMHSKLDGTNIESLVRFKKNLRGISVDWTTGNVYYIDVGVPSIEVVDQTGKFSKVIVSQASLEEPVDIIVLPSKGYVSCTCI